MPKAALAARWAVLVFGIFTLLFVVEFLMVNEPDPVCVLPTLDGELLYQRRYIPLNR